MVDVVMMSLQATVLFVFTLVYGQQWPKIVVYDVPCIHGYESSAVAPGRLAHKVLTTAHDIPYPPASNGSGHETGWTYDDFVTGCSVFIDKTLYVKWEDGSSVGYKPLVYYMPTN